MPLDSTPLTAWPAIRQENGLALGLWLASTMNDDERAAYQERNTPVSAADLAKVKELAGRP